MSETHDNKPEQPVTGDASDESSVEAADAQPQVDAEAVETDTEQAATADTATEGEAEAVDTDGESDVAAADTDGAESPDGEPDDTDAEANGDETAPGDAAETEAVEDHDTAEDSSDDDTAEDGDSGAIADDDDDGDDGGDSDEWAIPRERLAKIIEGMLFVSGRVLTKAALTKAVEGATPRQVQLVLDDLMAIWSDDNRGMHLMEINSGYQFRSDSLCADYIREMLKARPTRLSRPALESLAIIAYRQPVTRADIEEIRGVDTGGVLKTLLDKKLIKILGKREEPGRPLMYGTSKDFLETFHIRSLKDLPTLQEYQELTEEHRAMVDTTYSRDEVAEAEQEQDKFFQPIEFNADESQGAKELVQAAEHLDMAVRQVDETVNEVLGRVPYDERDEDETAGDGHLAEIDILAEPRPAPGKARPAAELADDLDDRDDNNGDDDAADWDEGPDTDEDFVVDDDDDLESDDTP